jgi:branched-chain amino acid transport system substrate-binding protein
MPKLPVRVAREEVMEVAGSPLAGLSRRKFLKSSAGAGAALASSLAAPALLAQSRAPIKLGNLNSYTGAIAYASEVNLNAMNLYFD